MKTIVFIDAANLFYGGLKTLGWKIDYKKLHKYLKEKYNAEEIYYFGGIETYDYRQTEMKSEYIQIKLFTDYLEKIISNFRGNKLEFMYLMKNYKITKFFGKLDEFEYNLALKPVKTYVNKVTNSISKKADCDVDLAIGAIRKIDTYSRFIIMSGDVDFIPLYRFLLEKNKDLIVLSRSENTSKQVKKMLGPKFVEFKTLKRKIEIE